LKYSQFIIFFKKPNFLFLRLLFADMEDPDYEKKMAEEVAEQERKLMAKAGPKGAQKKAPMLKGKEVKIMIFDDFLLLF